MTINPILKQEELFERNLDQAMKTLPKLKSLESAEKLHLKIYEIYHAIFEKNQKLPQAKKKELISQISKSEKNIEKLFCIFTNTLLTKFPTAKINYVSKGNPHPLFIGKKSLSSFNNATHERKILGDGNCFFSAFLVQFLEVALKENRLIMYINAIKNDKTITHQLKTRILFSLNCINKRPRTLEHVLNDPCQILPLIYYLKHMAASVIKKDEDFLMAIRINDLSEEEALKGDESLEVLLETKVLRMGMEATEPLINALCKALDFPISIILPGRDPLSIEGKQRNANSKAFLLLKDGHYSVIYPASQPKTSIAPSEKAIIPHKNPTGPKPIQTSYFQLFSRPFLWIWSILRSLFS